MQVVFGIENHAIARAELARKIIGKPLGGDDEGTDGNDFLLQGACRLRGVAAGRDQHIFGKNAPACGLELERTRAIVRASFNFDHPRIFVNRNSSL